MKKCPKCGNAKSREDFYKNKARADGLDSWCKVCTLTQRQQKDTYREYQKAYREQHKAETKAYNARYREQNPEKVKEAYKQYRDRHKEEIVKTQAAYIKARRARDPLYDLAWRIRDNVRKSLQTRFWMKRSKTKDLLGCSFEELQAFLGPKPSESVHIDHVCPCAQAKNEEELLKLQHYTNLRWLPAKENIQKRGSRTPEGEELCRKLLGREWED